MSESLNRLIWDIFNNDYTEPEYTGRAMGKVSSSLKNLFFRTQILIKIEMLVLICVGGPLLSFNNVILLKAFINISLQYFFIVIFRCRDCNLLGLGLRIKYRKTIMIIFCFDCI